MSISSDIDLNDSEILRIEQGPMRYMKERQGKSMNLEGFRKAVIGQFSDIGFTVDVKTFDHPQPGVYGFGVVITGKNRDAHKFDPDQMVHEVVNNMLELPDKQAGVINTNGYAEKLRDKDWKTK